MAVDIAHQVYGLAYPSRNHLLSPPYMTDFAISNMPHQPYGEYTSYFAQNYPGDAGPATTEHRRKATETRQMVTADTLPLMPYPTPDGPNVATRAKRPRRAAQRTHRAGQSSINHYASSISTEPVSELAAFAAQILDFIWFGPVKLEIAASPVLLSSPSSPQTSPYSRPRSTRPSFIPTPVFLRFCHDILTLTQVSHSVVLLALLYIYRLKAGNPRMQGEEGSEYRLLITALLLANKYLDDNTYTNKTWSQVSNLSLTEINSMEVEFLKAVEHGGGLYTSEKTYYNWLKALEGLTFMKDKQTEKELRNDSAARDMAARDLAVKVAVQRARSLSPLAQWSDSLWATTPGVRPPRRNSSVMNELFSNKRLAMQIGDQNEAIHVDTPASSVSPLNSYRHPTGFESLGMRNASDPFTFAQSFSAADGATLLASFEEDVARSNPSASQGGLDALRSNPMDLRFYSLAAGKRLGVGHHQQIDPQRASALALAENLRHRMASSSFTALPGSSYHLAAPTSGGAQSSPCYIQSLPTSGLNTPSSISPLMMPFGQMTRSVQPIAQSYNVQSSQHHSTNSQQRSAHCAPAMPNGAFEKLGPQFTLQPSSFGLDYRHFGPPRYTSAFANAGIPGVWMYSAEGLESNFHRAGPSHQHRALQSSHLPAPILPLPMGP